MSDDEENRLKEIIDNMEFHVALLGGPGVGKTSLLRKIIKNYFEDASDTNSVVSISQEIMKH